MKPNARRTILAAAALQGFIASCKKSDLAEVWEDDHDGAGRVQEEHAQCVARACMTYVNALLVELDEP